jgi:hypothetical protein
MDSMSSDSGASHDLLSLGIYVSRHASIANEKAYKKSSLVPSRMLLSSSTERKPLIAASSCSEI